MRVRTGPSSNSSRVGGYHEGVADIYLTQNRRLPVLYAALRDYQGLINLSSASAVKLVMMSMGGVNKVNSPCTITDATIGQVSYAWASADVDTAGTFYAKFMVTIGGQDLPIPSDRFLVVEIAEDPA